MSKRQPFVLDHFHRQIESKLTMVRIEPNAPLTHDGFFWIISPDGNGVVAAESDNSGWTVYHQNQFFAPHDLVFSLIGTAVPEPTSMVLSLTGVAVIGLIRLKNCRS